MLELTLNTPFSTIIEGPDNITNLTDAAIYINGSLSAVPVSTFRVGNSNIWSIIFTPTATGVYSLYAFSKVQFRAQCLSKSLSSMLMNVEDEALGSWSWDKTTGVLTVLRQNGTVLATHNVVDNLTVSSRERLS